MVKLLNKKLPILICLAFSLTSSCTQPPPCQNGKYLTASPHKLSVHSGSVDTVFVRLLDRKGRPLSGMIVRARSTSPTVATVTPESTVTDVTGKATFTVKGISPGTTYSIISTDGCTAKVEIVFIGH
ncbi:MAG: hypothetical protein E3K32_10730 [wastewater metagenome]|nr:hypothetical protein [Candidatus Loosdrechtia aerotolerans]